MECQICSIHPKNRRPASYWDRYYFFQSGVEVYYKGSVYPILVNSPESETVEIKVGDKILSIPYNSIKKRLRGLILI